MAVVPVTGRIVSSLIPPKLTARDYRRAAGAPLDRVRVTPGRLSPIRTRSWLYATAAVDDRGKICAHYVLAALAWQPCTLLSLTDLAGLLVFSASEHGRFQLTPTGHLRIPVTLRHWYGLAAGARVLLVADPEEGRLVLHPPASLDAMVTAAYGDLPIGGAQ